MGEQTRYWVGLNMVKGIGAARMRNLLDYFGDAQAAWNASPEALQQAGLGVKVLETLQKLRASVSLDLIMEHMETLGIRVITWEDADYPTRLREVAQPPPVLYALGNIISDDDWAIAIVGTRRMTSYGRQVTQELANALAVQGITVVSGMARGVDAVAHQTALQAGGRTLAVLGSGLDRVYPPEHRRLADQIRENGALISDYPPGTPPDAANFPPRNRIISGLARAVVVVEASRSSGALITAAFAADQGREVFAVPGSIFAPQCEGTNLLIQQGARPYLNSRDLLDTLNMVQVGEQRTARAVLPADAIEAQLFSILGNEPLHVDELRALAGLPIEKVSSALVMMELKGLVRQVGGMQYIAVREPSAPYEVD